MKTKSANKNTSNATNKQPTTVSRGSTVIEALDLELLRSGDPTVYSDPLQSLEKKFKSLFPDTHEYASLSLYLQARFDDFGDALPVRDRMLSFFLLRVLECNHTLVELLVRTTSLHEKLFLLRLLLHEENDSKDEELYKESLEQQVSHADLQSRLEKMLTDSHTTTKLATLEQSRMQHKQTDSLRGMRSTGISPVLYAPSWKIDPEMEGFILRDRTPEASILRFEPRFERPVPPPLNPTECHWINPHTLPVDDPRKLLCWCPLTMDEEQDESTQQRRKQQQQPQQAPSVAPQSILDTITALRRQQQEEEGGRSRTRKMPTQDDEDDVEDEHVREVYDEEDEGNLSQRVKDADYYRMLFSAAFNRQIKPAQEEDLIRFMQRSPATIRGRLSPTRLPDLVHNNPRIATQALLIQRNVKKGETDETRDENGDNSSLWDEYMGVLVDVRPVNVNSMEVVNGLLKERCMDPQHLHAFVRNCIQSCEHVLGDRSGERQSRLVRMVCVFVQTLIRTRVLDVTENGLDNLLLIDLRPFCISFSKIKEAVSLYKLIEASSTSLERPGLLGG
jgi:hypothetical protein